MAETKINDDRAIGQDKAGVAEKVNEILASYTGEKAELVPILQQLQQVFGYLPEAAMSQIADFVNVPECSVFGVATFYAQFKFVPVGRNIIKVCRGTGCYVKGAPRLIDEIESQLGIKDGETTPDLEYNLETVACIGACALAPAMVIDEDTYGKITPSEAAKIISRDREKE